MKAKVTSLFLCLLLFPLVSAFAQQRVDVSGTVTDSAGEPLIGVSVIVKGTQNGISTDFDGNFTLKAAVGDVLVCSYIGYNPQEVTVKNGEHLNIVLTENTKVLDDVVVTALGIKREQKSLSYNVQQVKGDILTTNPDANFVNSLAGKVAGVNINASSSGTGGISKVVMRGTKSIMQSSSALYVIDGMPMRGGRSEGDKGAFGSAGTSEPIADINPEDIESMSVLNGAAAAALYGSDAANGAIVITTKKGAAGKTKVTVSSTVDWQRAFILPQFQSRYGTGQNGAYSSSSNFSWGAPLTPYNSYGYNVGDDYLRTGMVSTQAATFSTGTEKNQTYASIAAVNSKGIVPNNNYDRYNVSFRNTTNFLDDKMTLDLNASYIRQSDRNMVNQGTYMNPIVGAYLFPRGNDWADVRMYKQWDAQRMVYLPNWTLGDYNYYVQNPYWVNYRNLRQNKKDRYMLGAQLSYKVLPYLTLSGRVRIDNSYTDYTDKRFAGTSPANLVDGSTRGYFATTNYKEKQVYADFLASFNKDLGADFNLQANFGGSISDMQFESLDIRGAISDGLGKFAADPVGLTNFFAVQNLAKSGISYMQDGWHEQTQSIYASADLGWRQTYYLTLTGRNDWPSQLAGPNSHNSSFFYPSVGLSVLMTELIPNIPQDYLSFWKIRASWASVGSAFNRYIANPRYEWNSSTGTWSNLTQYPMYDLKPERTKSWEIGMNFRFLKDFTLDATWYHATTENQTFDPNLSLGKYSKIYIQTGAVRNMGMEFALRYDHTWGNFSWDTGLTYSYNRNKITDLASSVRNPLTGEITQMDQISFDGISSAYFILKKGGSMGDLYSAADLMRDDNGNVYINNDGTIATQRIGDKKDYIKLGNVNPLGNLAWNNTFRWKNLSASFMLSARLGGIVLSGTQARLDYFGVSEASGAARDKGYVDVNGGDRMDPEAWYSVVAAGDFLPQYYTYSATNVRLQEATLSYLIPRKWLGNVCDIKVSLVGRNLWMIYNKAPFDPESVASTNSYYQGIDYFMMPSLRSFGFNVNFNF